jgi:hypothetical protein
MTPFRVYDLSNPVAPELAGETNLPGGANSLVPSGYTLFALQDGGSDDPTPLKYLDVSDPTAPKLVGALSFSNTWAFSVVDEQGLATFPPIIAQYEPQELQLVQFSPTRISLAGAVQTGRWVARSAFVKGRVVGVSDMALAVIDASNAVSPVLTAEVPF